MASMCDIFYFSLARDNSHSPLNECFVTHGKNKFIALRSHVISFDVRKIWVISLFVYLTDSTKTPQIYQLLKRQLTLQNTDTQKLFS